LLGFVRTNSPTSARHGDSLGYIRIWTTPPRRLVFWNGAPSPYKWYQSHALVVCVDDVRSPQGAKALALAEGRGKKASGKAGSITD